MKLSFDRRSCDCAALVSEDTDSGRVFVLPSPSVRRLLSTPALRKCGVWTVDVPSADDLKESFAPVLDASRCYTFFQDAAAALSSIPSH